MKVKELIKQLKNCDGEKEILISSDEEGNEFKPICEVCKASGEAHQFPPEKIDGYIIYPNG